MSTFIIRNRKTLEQWTASSGKNAWKKVNHAKTAFANSSGKVRRDPLLKEFISKLGRYDFLKFNDQDVYEVVEVYSDTEVGMQKKLQGLATKLAELKQTLNRYSTNLTLEEYDILYGDIEELQDLVFETIEN